MASNRKVSKVLRYGAQAYDREMLRMKGPAAVTNFPAHTYGALSTAQNGQQRGKKLHLCAMVAKVISSEYKPVHFSAWEMHSRSVG